MIKLTRIDDRLLHGQVAFTWTPALGADCLLIANDKVAKDDFLKMTLGLAKPAGTKLLIKTLKDAVTFLLDERSKNMKVLLIINSVQDASVMAADVPEIKSINFGGLRSKEGSKLISKAVALTEEDLVIIKELISKDVELEVRQVPTDSKQLVNNLI
ncbi:fructoselysine and glucoselysine-specific PTS system IIB component [Mucilaginibacter frigoritolerans]|jgi:fructoselysine/glucoselysine PTS system EIIB component|uniref:Fructoselysine and glucoselysine-specific PTS system IIB component n=1 Tax=Mucilaginibacter frigoritolerans TaxID=652788 RepID=A0A562TYH8_9SPHI|nr:PTS sugar transporter subunit IIB [Mucilaginibacter frigoritolerans]TWI98659.1 fructoselysine and glucoselysine-specific PTS system IIB component [Mucilaginibacter frigoritolerans]